MPVVSSAKAGLPQSSGLFFKQWHHVVQFVWLIGWSMSQTDDSWERWPRSWTSFLDR